MSESIPRFRRVLHGLYEDEGHETHSRIEARLQAVPVPAPVIQVLVYTLWDYPTATRKSTIIAIIYNKSHNINLSVMSDKSVHHLKVLVMVLQLLRITPAE